MSIRTGAASPGDGSRRPLALLLALASLAALPTSAAADPPLAARIARLRAAAASAPGELEPRVRLVELLITERRSQQALVELDLLEALSPGEPVADRLRALALMNEGRDAEAIDALDRALSRRDDPQARWLRAGLLERSGRLEDALVDYEAVTLAQPGVERSAALARVQLRLERPAEARVTLEDGVERHHGAAVLRRALIELELSVGEPERALPQIDALIAAARVATRFRVIRAQALTQMGRTRAAAAELERALIEAQRLVDRRGSPLSLIDRGRVYLAMGRLAEASGDVRQALRRAPRAREGQRLLAEIRAAQRVGADR